ncbi:MAG: response regulator transcription factor [Rhodocyclaceae bacterium]|nr:response regulator transcription factor [Rhodocyclaceae bacterium]
MSTSHKALIHVVEDDSQVARLITGTLDRYGFSHEHFTTGGAFLQRLRRHAPTLCILDLGLPDMDGMDLLRELRDSHSFGLLVVTGRTDTHDRVTGLELGADDYVMKPFEPRELIARVRSVLRRYQSPVTPSASERPRLAHFADWVFEPATHTLIHPDGQQEQISAAEAQLLIVLLEHPNQILSREQLLGDRNLDALDRSIDLRISRLRKRLEENPQRARLIKTVYGAGYLLSCQVSWR